MAKLTTDDLKQIKEKTAVEMALRQIPEMARITVHIGDCGLAAGAREVLQSFMEEMDKADRRDIRIFAADCPDPEDCANEPKVTVRTGDDEPVVYGNVTPEKAKEIFAGHLLGGQVVTGYILH